MYKNQPYYIKSHNNINNLYSQAHQKRMNTMIYYLFPKTFIYLNCICSNTETDVIDTQYSTSLCHYLKQLEEHSAAHDDWEKSFYTSNPYRRLVEMNENRIQSLVRYEIIELYNLMKFSWNGPPQITTIHINKCTIRAIEHIRKRNPNDKHCIIEKLSTVEDFNKHVNMNAVDIAFCESASKNEYTNNINLLLQLCVCLSVLKMKGTCIIKLGDTFSGLSLDVITLLSHFFEKTIFVKPVVCYTASCEKYIVCKDFLLNTSNESRLKTFFDLYTSIIHCPPEKTIQRILNFKIPLFVCGKLEEVNSIMGQPRLEKIQSIILGMEYNTETNSDLDIEKCREWREKNNTKKTNQFLSLWEES